MPKIQRDRGKSLYSRANLKSSERSLSLMRQGSYRRAHHQSSLAAENPLVNFNPKGSSHFFPIVKLLKKLNYGFEIMPDPHTKENCFFIQDKFMNLFYDHYPEFVCFHVLCEVPHIDYTVVFFICLDTNGQCEIVSIGLIKSESIAGFAWFIEMFKKYNKSWDKIKFISCVHNSEVPEILLRAFPNRPLFLSFFDSLKKFKHDLFSVAPMLNQTDVSKALQIFEQMFFISSEAGFADLSKQLKHLSSHFFSLFKKNWLSKKEFWAIGLQLDSKLFLKSFNKYIIKIRKLKNSLNCEIELPLLIEKLHGIIFKQRKEYFQQFTEMFPPPQSSQHPKMHVIKKYSKHLSPYATELIIEQLNKAENMKNVQKMDQSRYKIEGYQIVASFNTCNCIFYTLLMLPCCHIFAVRNSLSLPLFVDSLVRPSWISSNYQNTFLDLHSVFILDENNERVDKINSSEQIEKFNRIVHISQEFWQLSLQCTDEVSQQRLDLFRNVVKAWKSNFKINIQICPKQTIPSDNLVESLENLPPDYFRELYGISLNDILDSENEFSSFSLSSENENDLI